MRTGGPIHEPARRGGCTELRYFSSSGPMGTVAAALTIPALAIRFDSPHTIPPGVAGPEAIDDCCPAWARLSLALAAGKLSAIVPLSKVARHGDII